MDLGGFYWIWGADLRVDLVDLVDLGVDLVDLGADLVDLVNLVDLVDLGVDLVDLVNLCQERYCQDRYAYLCIVYAASGPKADWFCVDLGHPSLKESRCTGLEQLTITSSKFHEPNI